MEWKYMIGIGILLKIAFVVGIGVGAVLIYTPTNEATITNTPLVCQIEPTCVDGNWWNYAGKQHIDGVYQSCNEESELFCHKVGTPQEGWYDLETLAYITPDNCGNVGDDCINNVDCVGDNYNYICLEGRCELLN